VKRLLEQLKKCKAGLNLVHQELIGWLWFAIGGCQRLSCPHTSKLEMSLQKGGEFISIKDYRVKLIKKTKKFT